jgi:Mg-chelatase subunit ChlD
MTISFTHPAALWALLAFLPLLALPFLGRPFPRGRQRRRLLLATGLRLAIGASVILGLADMRWMQPVESMTVVFVLDLSDSVPAAEQARAEALIRRAVATMPEGDRAAVVAFGERALVERLASEARDLPPVASVPGAGRTDIAEALRLALALFPEDSQKRIVLLSDGLENVGDAAAQADLVSARGVEIAVVPLQAPPAELEATLAELESPAGVRQGQTFNVTAVVASTVAQRATLRLLGDGELLESREVALAAGTQRIAFSLTAEATGFHRYHVELAPELDTLPQNNAASGFAVVHGPPRVLIAEGTPGEAEALRAALASTEVEVTVVEPARLPVEPAGLGSYDAVVLLDVPAGDLPGGTMTGLPVAVRELGRGLVMIGGEQGYGAGGYLRTPLEAALPVDMDVRSRTREPNVALVLAVDRSGSMGRCHCDDPDALPGQYERVATGLPKVDIAKDAVLMASEALGALDYLGVVAFDERALWALELQQRVDDADLQNAIGGIRAEGGTNIFAGLSQAEAALQRTEARVKHIILLTDGWSQSGSYDELTDRLAEEGITLSVVAAGTGSAAYLQGLAQRGGGRYYPVPALEAMPEIFFRETIEVAGTYVVEEPFYPLPAATTPILRGLDPAALPPLLGYNGTTPKATATTALLSPRGDPVLAQWHYGLGRAVAWTSDLKGRWASDWVTWEAFNRFAAQLVGWTLPDPAGEQLEVGTTLDGAEAHLRVDATDEAGRPRDLLATEARLVGPDLAVRTAALAQTASGRYEGSVTVAEPGTYLLHVVQRDDAGEPVAQTTTGLVVPYSPEYRRSGDGTRVLDALARATGGPRNLTEPREAFAPADEPVRRARPLWPTLLLAAALLFPLDVGARRLRLTARDWQQLTAWVRARLARQPAPQEEAEPAVLGELFQARERARARQGRPSPAQAGDRVEGDGKRET